MLQITETKGDPDKPWLWKPGQTGNPNGRPPGIKARDLARSHTEKAIDRLVRALDEPRNAVQAAIALLDRGWGKPKETIESTELHMLLTGIDAPPVPETLDEWLQRRRAELARTITVEAESDKKEP